MKVKIGKSLLQKKAKVDLGYDVSTTASFGHCQPIMCKEMAPNTEFDVEIDSFVRLSPLVSPTFGRIKYKTWHNFVPIADIWEPFENMLAQKPQIGAGNAGDGFIPQNVPSIDQGDLSRLFYTLDFNVTPYWVGNSVGTTALSTLTSQGALGLNDIVPAAKSENFFNFAYLANPNATGTSAHPWYVTSASQWSTIYSSISSGYTMDGNWAFMFYDDDDSSADRVWKGVRVLPDSADMLWIDDSSYTKTVSGHSKYVLLCQRLSDRQRRLRKVLLGLGYSLDTNVTKDVSILPLIAYYKAWFTTLVPQRDLTWTNTSAYRLIHYLNTDSNGTYSVEHSSTLLNMFREFLADLAETFYYDDANYYTAHIKSTAINASSEVNYLDPTGAEKTAGNANVMPIKNQQPAIRRTINASSPLGDVELRLVRILTKFVNKNTIIGGKIAEYLRAHYGADIINNILQNYFIGGDSTDIQISDVDSTNMSNAVDLGQYAGKGLGSSDGKNFKFKSDTFGYWIAFSAIVPKSGFYQGIDRQNQHLSRFDFFTPEFDALGFQASDKGAIYSCEGFGCPSLADDVYNTSSMFGFIPRYSEYKTTQKNIVNGDISLPTLRDSMSQYTLDRMLTPIQIVGDRNGTDESGLTNPVLYCYPISSLVADNYLREIGKNASLGNYDRLFYNNEPLSRQFMNGSRVTSAYFTQLQKFSGVDDNFIVHNIVNITAKIPMIPIGQSFDTDGDEDDAMSVDKV